MASVFFTPPSLADEEFFPADDNTPIVGDAEELTSGVGGNDQFYGQDNSSAGYVAIGDAYVMLGRSRGGDDYFSGGDYVGSAAVVDVTIDSTVDDPNGSVVFAGDADEMWGSSRGGSDHIYGGLNSSNVFAGDALTSARDISRGGNDYIAGGRGQDGYSTNDIVGDAFQFGAPLVTSFATGRAFDAPMGGKDELWGGDAISYSAQAETDNSVAGDSAQMYGRSQGGADDIHGGSALAYGDPFSGPDAVVLNQLVGDSFNMQGQCAGGKDTMAGGDAWAVSGGGGDAYAVNMMAGDAFSMSNGAQGGNDVMTGGNATGSGVLLNGASALDGYGSFVMNMMSGDALMQEGGGKFGNDQLTGGSGTEGTDGYAINFMYGDVGDSGFPGSSASDAPQVDALFAHGFAAPHADLIAQPVRLTYGNDVLTGGDQAINFMAGDTEVLHDGARGGNDVLTGGGFGTLNVLVGDAFTIEAGARAGRDVLISGHGNDQMWGDASAEMNGTGGADCFVFSEDNGADVIGDFRVGDRDRIDLSSFTGADFRSFATFVASGRMQDDGGGGVILYLGPEVRQAVELSGPSTVVLTGVSTDDLSATSFIF
ncbi:MAG: hypothetical protein JWQ07_783 [Ramlibacter sp.]|nr:hypothetical protein [Ramlibacter sp.]